MAAKQYKKLTLSDYADNIISFYKNQNISNIVYNGKKLEGEWGITTQRKVDTKLIKIPGYIDLNLILINAMKFALFHEATPTELSQIRQYKEVLQRVQTEILAMEKADGFTPEATHYKTKQDQFKLLDNKVKDLEQKIESFSGLSKAEILKTARDCFRMFFADFDKALNLHKTICEKLGVKNPNERYLNYNSNGYDNSRGNYNYNNNGGYSGNSQRYGSDKKYDSPRRTYDSNSNSKPQYKTYVPPHQSGQNPFEKDSQTKQYVPPHMNAPEKKQPQRYNTNRYEELAKYDEEVEELEKAETEVKVAQEYIQPKAVNPKNLGVWGKVSSKVFETVVPAPNIETKKSPQIMITDKKDINDPTNTHIESDDEDIQLPPQVEPEEDWSMM